MAKRVNKRFLVILTTIVVVGGIMGMGAAYVLPKIFKKDPAEQIAESQRLEKLGQLDDAFIAYRNAVGANPNDPELRVGLGDLYSRHVLFDTQNLGNARAAWESALGVDTTYKPALDRLLDFSWAYMQLSPRAEVFSAVREAAGRSLDADPSNATARARLNISTIRQAQANVTTRRSEIEKSIKALREMAKEAPADADLPYWAAQGDLYLAAQAAQRVTGREDARETVEQLEPEIARMLEGQDENAAMQLRAAQLYSMLAPLEAITRQGDRDAPTTAPSELAGKYNDKIESALAAARKYAQPTDALYVDIQLSSAEWERAQGKLDDMRKTLDDLVALRGQDPTVRLAYARVFRQDPKRRAELMELLAAPVDMEGAVGIEALRRQNLEADVQLELANLRLAALDTERDPAKRKAVLDRVTADAKLLEDKVGAQSVPMMELKGRLRLIEGKVPEAIVLLQQAIDRRGDQNPDVNAMLILANAYVAVGQTGQAEKLLRQVVARLPGFAPAWVQWIDVLVRDGRPDEARRQLDVFKQRNPDAKEIAGLEAMVEGGDKRTAFVEQLPENTPAERVRKATMLRGDGQIDEAMALAQAAFDEDPKYLPALEQLLEMLLAADRRDEAVALANRAIEANPDNAQLKLLPDRLTQRSPEEFEKWRLAQIRQEPDVMTRELALHAFYLQKSVTAAQQNNPAESKKQAAEAEAHLTAAEKAKPGDLAVAGRRFEFLLQQQRFDEASKVVLKLAAANADEVNGHMLRFRLGVARKDFGAAEAAARDITRERPQFALGWQYLGTAMELQGRHREAVQAFASAIERQGRNYAALKGLIQAQYALGNITEAKTVLDRARETFPNDIPLRELAISHELNYGSPAKAVAEREALYKKDPNQPGNALALAETYINTLPQRSDPAKVKEIVEKARVVLEAGIKKWPADARFQWPLAQVLLAQDDFLGGEKLLKDYAQRPEITDKAAVDLLLADYYTRANKPAMAEQSYRDAMQKMDDTSGVRQKLAGLLAVTGRLDEAVKELDGVAGPSAARQRVQILLAAGKTDAANEAIKQGLVASPASPELLNIQIEMAINAGQFDAAQQLVQQRLAKSDGDDTARFYSALIKMRRQPPDIQGAVRELAGLAQRNPGAVNVHALLADARYASNDVSGAIDDLTRAVQLAPQNRDLRVKLIEWSSAVGRWDAVARLANEAAADPRIGDDPAWPRALANALAANGQFADAEKQIARAISMVPPDAAGDLKRDQLFILNKAKNYAKVLKLTDEMLAGGQKDWWIYQFRGLARLAAKDPSALKEFDTALAALNPENDFAAADTIIRTIAQSAGPEEALKRIEGWEANYPRWRLVAGEILFQQSDVTAALSHIQPLEADAGKLPADVRASLYRSLGQYYYQLRPRPDLEKAIKAYGEYLTLQPNDVLGLNNLAYILAEEVVPARPEEARKYSERAYDIARDWRPGDPKSRVLDTHAWILVLIGDREMDRGIRILEDIVEESPLLEARYHLGEAQLRMKRAPEAERQLNLALAMVEKFKQEKKPYDEALEPRIQRALDRAKAMNAAAGAQ